MKLSQEMFPDSNIAKNFQLSRTKYSYIFNRGLAPQSKLILTHEIPLLPSYRNQSIDLHSKSNDWSLYEDNTGI